MAGQGQWSRTFLPWGWPLSCGLMVGGCTTRPRQNGDDGDRAGDDRDQQADLSGGKTKFREANYGLAEKHFRKAVELRADNSEAWMGLAASYDQLGRFDFADRAYDQLLKVAGRRPEIFNNMGYSQLLRGNKKKARQLLNEAKNGMADTTVVEANLALLKKG